MAFVLIIDDDADLTKALSLFLESREHKVLAASRGDEAMKLVMAEPVDVVLLDLGLGDLDGLELLEEIRAEEPELPVIILTGNTQIPNAVKAMKRGAFDYLPKPCRNEEISIAIDQALKESALKKKVEVLRERLTRQTPSGEVVAQSPAMTRVLEEVSRIAPTDLTVIIQGESGTGKELIARRIHAFSQRRSEDFVAVDCGALPESLVESELFGHEKGAFTGAHQRKLGFFEVALGGTLFLDEIGNLTYAVQMKLLRAIQERRIRRVGGSKDIPFDARIIAASNVDLAQAVERGKFREDLYHRLNQFSIHLPPLRERPEDILPLARGFLKEANIQLKKGVRDFSPETAKLLQDHGWPGNVRELKNAVTRSVLLSDTIIEPPHLGREIHDAAPRPRRTVSLKDTGRTAASHEEKRMILDTLRKFKGNKVKTAKALKINRMTLYLKIKKYGIPA